MKVIHINSDYGNTIYKNLSYGLRDLGVDQRVFKFLRPSRAPKEAYDDFVDVRINHRNFDRYIFHIKHLKAYRDFLNLYKDQDIDLIHGHTLFSNGYIAYKVFKSRGIPYVVSVRGTDISVFFKYMVHLRRMGLDILLNARRIIFLSYAHRDTVLRDYVPSKYRAIIEEKSLVIPNGIDDYYFERIGQAKSIKNKDQLTLLTTAWINANKNQINVCKAIDILNKKGYRIRYRIVGGVEQEGTYGDLVNELGTYDFVDLLPRMAKEDLVEEYRRADIFALVSHKETFGLSYVEAMLQATPIVYSKGQGIDGYFHEGRVGFAAQASSVEDIGQKIEEVISNYDFLSKNTLELVEDFKWSKIAERILEVYK